MHPTSVGTCSLVARAAASGVLAADPFVSSLRSVNEERVKITFRWIRNHLSRCFFGSGFGAGVTCCLPTCAGGSHVSTSAGFGCSGVVFWVFCGFCWGGDCWYLRFSELWQREHAVRSTRLFDEGWCRYRFRCLTGSSGKPGPFTKIVFKLKEGKEICLVR